MLAALVLAVTVPLQAPGAAARRFPGTWALDPCVVSSPSGVWRLSVEPRTREGGPALHRLERHGVVAWTRDEPWTLRDAAVTDTGRVAGWHYDAGGWRVVVLTPTAHPLVDDSHPCFPGPEGRPGPGAFRVDLARDVLSFHLPEPTGPRRLERVFSLDTGTWLGDFEAPPVRLPRCGLGSPEPVPVEAEPFELQLLETIELSGRERVWSVRTLPDGRFFVRDALRDVSVFDARGRRLFHFTSAGMLGRRVEVDSAGRLELGRIDRGDEAILVLGLDGSLLEERACSWSAVLGDSVRVPGTPGRWVQAHDALAQLTGEDTRRRITRFPDGTWFQTGPMGVARDGSVAVLAQPWSAAHPSLSAWDAEGEPRAMVSLPGFPDAVSVFAFDGWRAALATADALFVVELDPGRVRRAPLPADRSATGRYTAFSPTGREIFVPRLEPPAVLVFRVPL